MIHLLDPVRDMCQEQVHVGRHGVVRLAVLEEAGRADRAGEVGAIICD